MNDAVNGGELLEAAGKVWTLSHVGPGIRARFSSWVKLRARREVAALKRDLDPGDYREALAVLSEEAAAGSYNWGTPLNPKGMGTAVRAALSQEEGQLTLLRFLLEPTHREVSDDALLGILEDAGECAGAAITACLGLGLPNFPTPEVSPGGKRLWRKPTPGTTTA